MRLRITIAAATLLGLVLSMFVAVPPALAAVGLRVSNGRIFESNGNEFIMRGVSHAHTWYPSQTSSFANIKSLGANTVRVVLSGGRWQPANGASDVANVVSLCKANRLICVLENHDTTGYGEQSGAVTLDVAVNYWISVQSALAGQENYVVLNIGNEPVGNNPVTPNWTQATMSAIGRLRSAGFQHMIMVDAPNWGQDWQFTMRDNAAQVFNSDPQRNIVFSIHMYGVFNTAAEVSDYLGRFQTAGLPIVVGEFGHNHSDGDPDEDAIMSNAQSRGLGYIGWSWSGNSGGVEYLDMVNNFNVGSLTIWGQRIFNGANGIRQTAREATIYGGGGGADTTPPSAPSGLAASGVTSSSVNLSWTASTDNVGVSGYEILRAPGASGGSFSPVGTSATTTFSNSGLSAATTYRYQVRARDAANNVSAVSNTVTVTTQSGGGGGGACTATLPVESDWGAGYVVQATVGNPGSSTLNGWTVTFTLPSGHQIVNSWNAVMTISGQTVAARNMSYNGTIGPNGSTNFGFQASRSGGTALPGTPTCTSP